MIFSFYLTPLFSPKNQQKGRFSKCSFFYGTPYWNEAILKNFQFTHKCHCRDPFLMVSSTLEWETLISGRLLCIQWHSTTINTSFSKCLHSNSTQITPTKPNFSTAFFQLFRCIFEWIQSKFSQNSVKIKTKMQSKFSQN